MALFEIEVREVFSRNALIEAESVSDVLDEIKEKYEHEEIVLDADNLISQDFFPADSLQKFRCLTSI